MANIVSARKRARQANQRRLHNMGLRSSVRTAIRKVLRSIAAGDKAAAEAAYKEVVPAIDRSVSKGIMHRNKAARHKARLNQHVREMA